MTTTETEVRICAAPGCDAPIPPGSRADRRTHTRRCRQRLSRAQRAQRHPPADDDADIDEVIR